MCYIAINFKEDFFFYFGWLGSYFFYIVFIDEPYL